MYKVRYNILKLKKFKLIQTYAVTQVCLLKVLLNLYRMYRYNSGTTIFSSESLVQTLSSKREKYNRHQDAHEYYI